MPERFLSNRRLIEAKPIENGGWRIAYGADPIEFAYLDEPTFRFLFQDMADIADLSGEVVLLLREAGKAAKKEGVPVHIRHLLLAAGSLLPANPLVPDPNPPKVSLRRILDHFPQEVDHGWQTP